MSQINETQNWQALEKHHSISIKSTLKKLFLQDPNRSKKFSLEAAGIFLDYSKNRISTETIQLLIELANASGLEQYREKMFAGEAINFTEKRAVLHCALREPGKNPEPIMSQVHHELKRIEKLVTTLREHKWHGFSGNPITDVVNIGIGGSDLGPAMAVAALTPYTLEKLKVHFVSNLDATHIFETLKELNPETTLFIIASKTFTTQETLTNANTAKEWLLNAADGKSEVIEHHFVAVSAKPERAKEFGISEDNIFPFWDWVGGRFSLWSAIGLPVAIAIGMDKFYELLEGAHAMDEHFKAAPLEKNLPVILGLLGIWNINFLGATSQAIIPYDQYLSLLPAFLQQLEMESNGKRVDFDGNVVTYNTAPIIWGSVGTNGQHAFHQLLMQGTHIVPVDFILPLQSHNPIGNHHMLLAANCFAQSQALMSGRDESEVASELKEQGLSEIEIKKLLPYKIIPGNIPSNTIIVEKVTPKTLGALIALYEHKVFVQGVIWRINSFDQWGVELGKKLATKIIPMLEGETTIEGADSSTRELIRKFL